MKLNKTLVKFLKFEAKLFAAVIIGGLIMIWALNTFIYSAGEKVANSYTSTQPLFR